MSQNKERSQIDLSKDIPLKFVIKIDIYDQQHSKIAHSILYTLIHLLYQKEGWSNLEIDSDSLMISFLKW